MKRQSFRSNGEPMGDMHIGDKVPDVVFTTTVLGMLEDMTRELIRKDGWDVPAFLSMMMLRHRSPVLPGRSHHSLVVEMEGLANSVNTFMSFDRPHEAIAAIAELIQKNYMQPTPDFLAACFFHEGYTLFREDAEDIVDVAERREIENHPKRVECKVIAAADVNGVCYLVSKPRDSRYPTTLTAGMLDDTTRPGGIVPISLVYLVDSMMGKTLPPFDEFTEKYYPPERD